MDILNLVLSTVVFSVLLTISVRQALKHSPRRRE